MSAAAEETVEIPPSEKAQINSMANAFKEAVKTIAKPAAIAPAEPPAKPAEKPSEAPKPTEKPHDKPAEQPKPSDPAQNNELKGKAREQFENLEKLMKKYKGDYESLKAQTDSVSAERDDLKTKLEAASKGTAEYEAAKQRLDEYDKIVKQFYIEHDPQFQSHFGQRISSAVLEAKEAVGPELSSKIETALQFPPSPYRDRQVAELAEGLDDFSKAALVTAYTELKRTERDRAAQLSNSKENHKKLLEVQSKQAREEAEKANQHRMLLLNQVNAQIDPDLVGVEPTVAASIKESVAKIVTGSASTEDYVQFLIRGAKSHKLSALEKEKDEKIAKLEAQLSELQTTQPSISGGPAQPHKAKAGELEDIGAKYKRLAATIPTGSK